MKERREKQGLHPWLLLIATSSGVVAIGLNSSIMNVAIPVLSEHFQSSATESSWMLLSFMLFNSVLILVFGRLADIFGRRKLYLIGVAEYTLSSFLCGLAPTAFALILLRILQAVGAAMLITNTVPLITDTFPKKRLGQALGINHFVLSISQLIGPVVGGYLIVAFDWRWLFWINVPLTLVCLIWGFFNIDKTPATKKRDKIDMLGNVYTLFGLGGLVIGLSVASEAGFFSWQVLISLAVFAVCFIAFLRHEKRIDYPMVDLELFKAKIFAMATLAAFLAACMRAGVLLLISLHAQYIMLNDAQTAGFIVLPMAIGTAVAAPIAGTLTRRLESKYLSTGGIVVSLAGVIVILAYVTWQIPFHWLLVGEFFAGLGCGAFFVPNTTTVMLTVPSERRGIANGIRSMLQNVGRLTSTALSMMLITVLLSTELKNAVFRGQVRILTGEEAMLFTNGFQIAYIAMILLGVAAIIASWSRGKRKQGTESKKQ